MKISIMQLLILSLIGFLFFGDVKKIQKKILNEIENFRKKGI